jgi:UPF0176 protein
MMPIAAPRLWKMVVVPSRAAPSCCPVVVRRVALSRFDHPSFGPLNLRVMHNGPIAEEPVTVAALYRFAAIADPESVRTQLLHECKSHAVRGTLIVALEGINGTIAGSAASIEHVVGVIRSLDGFEQLDVKYSSATAMPFFRLKVHHKREIVTLGVPEADPTKRAGTYVSPDSWNVLIDDPETLVIDCRNTYETRIGTFANAVDPGTATFREFPEWFRENRETLMEGKQRVAMFCTGGIRCEKSTAFLRSEGIDDVYHLEGGILRYLETVDEQQSRWDGECFVFDQRVAVGHGLAEGTFGRCYACREPLSTEDRMSTDYVEGISCPHCVGTRNDRLERYAERQRQTKFAESRGEEHLGVRQD